MKFKETALRDCFIIELEPHTDFRGFFERIFCKKEMLAIGFSKDIVQINHSLSKKKGTLRGMHYQLPPFTETRIIKCIKGAVFDVAIDIRKKSPTFLHSFGFEITEKSNLMFFIPEGFAHGFQTLSNNAELLYFHTGYYNPESDVAVNYSDPFLDLKFPMKVTEISFRDLNHPYLDDPWKELPDF
jgi:dTDP-4-dehydrorhamnose 3,5-epimerase